MCPGYGDFIAGILAIIATAALARTASWAIATVWIFNVWGSADLSLHFIKVHASIWSRALSALGSTS